jgi:hypothetical protein
VSECRQAIHSLGLEEQVTIPGFVEDPRSYYEAADYLLCSSEDESFPQSILKAMASGMRVITTPVGGTRELVRNGFSGVVADGIEVDDLVAAIKRALEIPETQWQRMLENAHQSARVACSEEVVAYKLLKLYNFTARENAGSGQAQTDLDQAGAARERIAAKSDIRPFMIIAEQPKGEHAEDWAILRPSREFRLLPPADNLVGLQFMIGAISPPRTGYLLYELLQNGSVIRQGQIGLSQVTGDSWVSVTFDRVTNSGSTPFIFRATIGDSSGIVPEVSIYEYIAGGPWMNTNVFRRGKRWAVKRFWSSRRLACRYLFER